MSKTKMMIMHKPYYDSVRDVLLNRDGVLIGQIVRWRGVRLAYLSWRTKEHYYIKERGFAVDSSLLMNMIRDDRIDLVIIEYHGERGLRYFIASVDDWVMKGVPINYNKDRGDTIETYGRQLALCEDYMNELLVEQ
jgi:hypothetical protein